MIPFTLEVLNSRIQRIYPDFSGLTRVPFSDKLNVTYKGKKIEFDSFDFFALGIQKIPPENFENLVVNFIIQRIEK